MLWVVPLSPETQGVFAGWTQAGLALKPFIEENLGHLGGQSYGKVLARLCEAHPAFLRDPFLFSSYWEQTADVNLKQMLAQERMPAKEAWVEEEAMERNALSGYPAAHLYFRSGIFLERAGMTKQARRAFEEAIQAPANFTESKAFLDRLDRDEKGTGNK
jgi:hypothetical protein